MFGTEIGENISSKMSPLNDNFLRRQNVLTCGGYTKFIIDIYAVVIVGIFYGHNHMLAQENKFGIQVKLNVEFEIQNVENVVYSKASKQTVISASTEYSLLPIFVRIIRLFANIPYNMLHNI